MLTRRQKLIQMNGLLDQQTKREATLKSLNDQLEHWRAVGNEGIEAEIRTQHPAANDAGVQRVLTSRSFNLQQNLIRFKKLCKRSARGIKTLCA
jgi:hypothetical protein